MVIFRCDVCASEVPAEQPNYYAVDPHGWFATLGKALKGGPRRTAPHACSAECAKMLMVKDPTAQMVAIDRKAIREAAEARSAPKGSVGCSVCRRTGTGKKCIFHGIKPDGWPLVTNDGSHKKTEPASAV